MELSLKRLNQKLYGDSFCFKKNYTHWKLFTLNRPSHLLSLMYLSNRSFNMPPPSPPGIWHLCRPGEEGIYLCRPGEEGIWLSESSRGWGVWSPCFRGGEFELHLRFHVKSLAWRAIMGDAVLEDFRGKDCAFVANWLRGKGLNKLCAVFEVFKF